jgi:hypothetical protein
MGALRLDPLALTIIGLLAGLNVGAVARERLGLRPHQLETGRLPVVVAEPVEPDLPARAE